jgi:DNA-directed RNA polymerase subunit RPC12/RpoP
MIHYTCDRCKRQIDTAQQTRYIIQIETQAATEETDLEIDDDLDQLAELHEFLEALHNEPFGASEFDGGEFDTSESETPHQDRYDLCPDCHEQFLKNPFGRDASLAFGFSNN